ncbi:MAG: T9SS type A sorting domain-containing protein [Chlorobi bacterium]|nr:T9SS type A sorting domain-containing protein [Chlorobiota bacterium]
MRIKLIMLGFLISSKLFSQGSWEMVSPQPTINNLFDVCFVSEQKGWIVGANGTIISTNNSGESWEWEYQDNSKYFESVFFIDENEGWVVGWDDILHTEDGGETWEEQDLPAYSALEAVYFIDSNTGWVAGHPGSVFKTINGGEDWTQVLNAGNKWLSDIVFTDLQHGVAIGSYNSTNGAYTTITEDGGETWENTSPLGQESLNAIEFISVDTAFVCGNGQKIIKTTDGGHTWETISNFYSSKSDIHFFNSKHGIILASNSAYITDDGGTNWNSVPTQYGSSLNAFSFVGPIGYAVGFNGGMIKSPDYGETWENTGSPQFTSIEDLYFSDTLNGWAKQISSSKLSRTFDGGVSWESVDIGSPEILGGLCFTTMEIGYAVGAHHKLFKTEDGGENWVSTDLGIEGANINSIYFIDELRGFICGSYGLFYATNDGGNSWDDIGQLGYLYYTDIYFSDENNGWIISYQGKTYHTTDGGNIWEESSLNGISGLDDIFFLDNEKGFITSLEGLILMTEDAGISWVEVGSFIESANRAKLSFANNSEGWLIASTKLYYTIDGGFTWHYHSHQGYMTDISFQSPTSGTITGSYSLVLKYDNMVTSLNIPHESKLEILPNPASNYFSVSLKGLDLHASKINIYDIHGRLYKSVNIKGDKNKLNIDIHTLPKGLYFVVLETRDNRFVAKLIKQ